MYLENKISPKSSAALDFALGTMYYQRGRLTRSYESYNSAIQKFPSFLRAHKNLAFVKLGLGNYEDAAKSFSKSISLGEGDGVTYIALGYCYYLQEQFVSAENAYRMGILLWPESKDGRNGLVNCLLETGRFPEALALLDELLKKEPNNEFCHMARASALMGLGREKDATVTLETLRRMGDLTSKDLITLGDLYHNLNLFDLSLKNYERAILNESRDIDQDSLMVKIKSNKLSEKYLKGIPKVSRANQKITSLDDDIEVKALIEHARMLVSIRSFEKAIRLLEKAQEINPQPRVTRYLVSIRNILLSSKVRL